MSTQSCVAHLHLVPNSFTALSMLFGAYAIALASDGQFQLASWLVLWGVLLDKLDGTAARASVVQPRNLACNTIHLLTLSYLAWRQRQFYSLPWGERLW